ncbi:hypothetical protein AMECASPLE_039853 [Ameca splendens]|uniref:Uncharacterized protein n=1 Tax=Ameca splendens TaxID=208324 RepID=A0ABV0Y8K6_9TELE
MCCCFSGLTGHFFPLHDSAKTREFKPTCARYILQTYNRSESSHVQQHNSSSLLRNHTISMNMKEKASPPNYTHNSDFNSLRSNANRK